MVGGMDRKRKKNQADREEVLFTVSTTRGKEASEGSFLSL